MADALIVRLQSPEEDMDAAMEAWFATFDTATARAGELDSLLAGHDA